MSYLDSIDDQGDAYEALKNYENKLNDIKFDMMNGIYLYMYDCVIVDRKREVERESERT